MELLNNDEKIQKFILAMIGTGISPDKASELCVKVIEAQLHKHIYMMVISYLIRILS